MQTETVLQWKKDIIEKQICRNENILTDLKEKIFEISNIGDARVIPQKFFNTMKDWNKINSKKKFHIKWWSKLHESKNSIYLQNEKFGSLLDSIYEMEKNLCLNQKWMVKNQNLLVMLHVDDSVHCKHSWLYAGIDTNFGNVQQI